MTTPRELLQTLKSSIETESQIEQSEIRMTPIHGDGKSCVARILVPVIGGTKVVEIIVKEICVYPGLETVEHLVP